RVGELVTFAAVVQQISAGKRAVADQQRVSAFHVLLLADATRSFFQLTCWGDVPVLSSLDHAPSEVALRVGDIVLFSACLMRSFRGVPQAQFQHRRSRVQLLYRRDRYFNTRDVRLQDLYPMIEWYKRHRKDFLLVHDPATTLPRTHIRDLRENMVVSVLCHVRPPLPGERAMDADGDRDGHGGSNSNDAAAYDVGGGAVLHEVVMVDGPQDAILLHLWDQHAEPRFVDRLLNHAGAIDVRGVVVCSNVLSGQLLVSTTPQSSFGFIEASDPDALALEHTITGGAKGVAHAAVVASIDNIESSAMDGDFVLTGARVEQIVITGCLRHADRFTAQDVLLLVECYCSACEAPLPELDVRALPPLYGRCRHRCAMDNNIEADRFWRYRTLRLVVRDAKHQRLTVNVPNDALVGMLSGVTADMLVNAQAATFASHVAVAGLLNGVVADGTQTFSATVHVATSKKTKRQSVSDLDNSDLAAGIHDRPVRRNFMLKSLVPDSPHFAADVIAMADEQHLSFFVEWLDPQSAQIKPFILHFYGDGTLELVERHTKRPFLKRIRIPSVQAPNLFVGASVTIYSRQMNIIEAANVYTQCKATARTMKAMLVIHPRGYSSIGQIISSLERAQTQITNMALVKLERKHLDTLNAVAGSSMRRSLPFDARALEDVSVLVEVNLPTSNSFEDINAALESASLIQYVVSAADCGWETFAKAGPLQPTAVLDNCSLCLIRPRILREGRVGDILDAILRQGFEISALNVLHLRMSDADEFFAVYKGVIRHYNEVLKYMCSGPCIALEIRGEDVVRRFRDACGPFDVDIAKVLQPASIRANFGKSTLLNAVHCTDCPEDGVLECQFIFNLLQS
ncbi:TPA: hypothetical protein N0F65_012621, partial [Lagenidium giganteum]